MQKLFNIFLIILSFVFLTACSFAADKVVRPDDYKPIPANLSKQYKQEMEKIIAEEIPKSKQYVDDNFKKAEYLRNKMILNGYTDNDFLQLVNIVDVGSLAYDLNIFKKMIQITQEKYLRVKYKPFGGDNSYSMEVYLYPYMQDNKINVKPIIKLSHYADKKYKIVEKYIIEIRKLYQY